MIRLKAQLCNKALSFFGCSSVFFDHHHTVYHFQRRRLLKEVASTVGYLHLEIFHRGKRFYLDLEMMEHNSLRFNMEVKYGSPL